MHLEHGAAWLHDPNSLPHSELHQDRFDRHPESVDVARRGASFLKNSALVALAPFALIGLQHTFRTSALHTAGGEHGPTPPASDPEFPRWIDRFTRASFDSGNQIEILRNGDETFPRLWADLTAAEHSIDFQTYYAESGQAAARTCAILAAKARAGVSVRVLYDPVGCRGLDGTYLEALRQGGAEVHVLRPLRISDLDRINHRVHSRVVVIDDGIGYTGDFGISDKWLGDGRTGGSWRSTNARFRGPALRQHSAVFETFWAEVTGNLIVEDGGFADSASSPGHHAGLLHSSPGVGSTAAERVWALTLAGARETCFIATGYFAPTATQVGSLAEAARRGVDVRILTASVRHTDAPPAYWAGRSCYDVLLQVGVRIYEYQPSMMHAKSWVVDGTWCSIGALNLDNRSVALNDEVALMVHDRELGTALSSMFMEDLAHSREVTRADLDRSRWTERARAWGARQINPLL